MSTKKAREIDTRNRHCREMDAMLAERPAVIEWRKNTRGVFVAIYVNDPLADSSGVGSRTAAYRAWQRRQAGAA